MLIAVAVGCVLLGLLATGAYLWKQRGERMANKTVFIDSIEAPIDPSLLYEDKFQSFERKESYEIDLSSWRDETIVTETGEQEDWFPRSCTYTKELSLEWPLSLKGVQHVDELQARLLSLLFGQAYPTIEAAVEAFWKAVPTADNIGGFYDPSEAVELERTETAAQCVQFKVTLSGSFGGATGSSFYENLFFLTYDKTRQKILTLADVFEAGTASAIVSLINREIVETNRKEAADYANVSAIPEQFSVGREGITFISTESISYSAQGRYLEVMVPYTLLMPYLTADFATMLKTPDENLSIHE